MLAGFKKKTFTVCMSNKFHRDVILVLVALVMSKNLAFVLSSVSCVVVIDFFIRRWSLKDILESRGRVRGPIHRSWWRSGGWATLIRHCIAINVRMYIRM